MNKSTIKQIIALLISAYGDRQWHQQLEPVGELILTILSQNTSDTNSRRAYHSLTEKFGNWDQILIAATEDIAAAIRSGGLAEVKSRYIRNTLTALRKETGDFDLSFLKRMPVNEARRWLIKLPGVGMKTASCVLLFSLGMPAFPVDTHVYRVAGRLGLIGRKISPDAAHMEMERLTPADDTYRCHVLLIEHGRKTCRAQRPLCRTCVLSVICPTCKIFIS
ncbi:MAG: endonuclease III [Dehalococcoidia bacterium]|nr:endonuclease III [Dehalococcoidia bacterium]